MSTTIGKIRTHVEYTQGMPHVCTVRIYTEAKRAGKRADHGCWLTGELCNLVADCAKRDGPYVFIPEDCGSVCACACACVGMAALSRNVGEFIVTPRG